MSDARPVIFTLLEDARDLPLVELGRSLGDVVVLSMSAPTTDGDPLLVARRLGAARTVRIWDPALAGVDYLGIAHVLACAVRQLAEKPATDGAPAQVSPVIVLASDRGRGAVGPAVAERLAVPHLGSVRAVEIADGQVVVARMCGTELRRFSGAPPVVLVCALGGAAVAVDSTVGDATAPAPHTEGAPTGETFDLAALQITAPELLYRRRFKPVPGDVPKRRPHVVANIEVLSQRLARDGLWPVPEGEG